MFFSIKGIDKIDHLCYTQIKLENKINILTNKKTKTNRSKNMANKNTINFKRFEEIDFNETASPARISKKTEAKIESFREKHERRGALTLAAYH